MLLCVSWQEKELRSDHKVSTVEDEPITLTILEDKGMDMCVNAVQLYISSLFTRNYPHSAANSCLATSCCMGFLLRNVRHACTYAVHYETGVETHQIFTGALLTEGGIQYK